MTNASQLTLSQPASTIKAHAVKAEQYADKADQHYISAGKHLIEARARTAAGEYAGGFAAFLKNECAGLSRSRAYELIAIADGTTTVATVRADKAASMQRSRARVRHVVDTKEPTAAAPGREPEEQRGFAVEVTGYYPYEVRGWMEGHALDTQSWEWKFVRRGLGVMLDKLISQGAPQSQFPKGLSTAAVQEMVFEARNAGVLERLKDDMDRPWGHADAIGEALASLKPPPYPEGANFPATESRVYGVEDLRSAAQDMTPEEIGRAVLAMQMIKRARGTKLDEYYTQDFAYALHSEDFETPEEAAEALRAAEENFRQCVVPGGIRRLP